MKTFICYPGVDILSEVGVKFLRADVPKIPRMSGTVVWCLVGNARSIVVSPSPGLVKPKDRLNYSLCLGNLKRALVCLVQVFC